MLTPKTYEDLAASDLGGGEDISSLPARLMPLWCDDYYDVNPGADLVTIGVAESGSTITYLFDLDLTRIVVACGVPIVISHSRDYTRQKGQAGS
jgi:hypothetical protein